MKRAFMERAIALARVKSTSGINGPFGAVVVKNESIVGEGWNQVVENSDPSAHAEVMAIRDACHHLESYSLEGCELYASCEPCPMCLAAIYWARIERLYFACKSEDAAKAGFDDSVIYQQLGLSWEDRSLSVEHDPVGRVNGLEVFKRWIANQDRVSY